MEKIGFTIGKFAPLHKGHQYLIETALDEMEKFYIVIYETDVINISIEKRASWIKKLYPQVKVLYASNPPKKYGLDKESVKIQMDFLEPIVKDLNCTHFYSSEKYGEYVAKSLNIIDRRVDQNREKNPISGTMIRNNIIKNNSQICQVEKIVLDDMKYVKNNLSFGFF